MAASMECSFFGRIVMFILLVILLTRSVNTQDTTTQPPTSTNGSQQFNSTTTDQATTTPVLTTTQVITTTESLPTFEPSSIPENTDIGTCTCDLTVNSCDVNCCCDDECTDTDRSAFSVCDDIVAYVDDTVCVQESVVYTGSGADLSDYYVTTVTSDGLFCVTVDNYEERNYYTVPSSYVTDESVFDEYVSSYSTYTATLSTQTEDDFTTQYTAGSYIYTVYESDVVGKLGLPASVITSTCDDSNYALFLQTETSECTRLSSPDIDLSTECTSNTALALSTYYKYTRLIPYVDLFSEYVNDTETGVTTTTTTTTITTSSSSSNTIISTTSDSPITTPTSTPTSIADDISLYNHSSTLPWTVSVTCYHISTGVSFSCTGEDEPSYDSTTDECDNVIYKVSYVLTYNGSEIMSADIEIYLINITSTDLPLTQTFSIEFISVSQSGTTFARSGNPGYVLGYPVLAGTLLPEDTSTGDTLYAIDLSSDTSKWLTVVAATVDGTCNSDIDNRANVNFGVNMMSGCLIKVALSNFTESCEYIQDVILSALHGQYQPTYVATFGNSDINITGDWVEVIINNYPTGASASGTGVCANMVMGMNIEILYAYAGSLANPQAKIVGVMFDYSTGQTLTFECISPYCQPGTSDLTQSFEVYTAVSFVDVSEKAEGVVSEIPVIKTSLPNDFFYPFVTTSSSSSYYRSLYHLCLYITLFILSTFI